MTFPFDGEDHRLHIGESYTGQLQYHSVKYDFKPPSIDFDKEGILESDGTKCKIRLPNKIKNEQPAKQSTVYEGKIQEIEKECILIIDRKTNTITLERVTSKVSVRNTREKDDKAHDFRVARALDKPAVSSLNHHHPISSSNSSGKKNKPERKSSSVPQKKQRNHESVGSSVKREPKIENDIIMPTLGGDGGAGGNGSSSSSGSVLGLNDVKQEKVEKTTTKPSVPSLFSPGNSDSSSSSSSSDESENDDDDDDDQSSDEDSDDSNPKSTNPPKHQSVSDNPTDNPTSWKDQLELSEESGSDDTME